MNSGFQSTLPPEVSGALRYERVAQLEAVLRLRETRRRTRAWTMGVVAFVAAVAGVAWMVF